MARKKSIFVKMMEMKEGSEPLVFDIRHMRTVKNYRTELRGMFPSKDWEIEADEGSMTLTVRMTAAHESQTLP